jgi:hypothetical protein
MAQFINNKVGVKLGSADPANIDLSAYCTGFTLNRAFSEIDVTAMGDTGVRQIAGLETSNLTIEFINDNASTAVLQTLNTLVGTNAYFKVANDKSAAGSAANPFFSGLCLINNITPINGAVGDLSTQSVTFNVSGAITKTETGTF